ncbi:MAG TPA: glycosyltransferase, partial [Thermoanaerobaculia bacterium]
MLFARDFLADQRVFRSPKAPERPTVSVILPTWRRAGLLRRAVGSVLSQGFGDLELIVVDDGSTDGTADLLAEVQAADGRLVHVRHELNCGLPALRVNEGIELARGRFVAFQFDDDEWLEGALEALVAAARELAEPALVCGGSLLVGPGDEERELPGIEVNLLTLSFQNRIANNAALLPRAAFALCGLYDPHVGMRRFCDWDLWLRCAQRLPIVAVDRRVSKAYVASDAGAIGATVPADLPLFRYLHAIPRDHLLAPERWRDYEVDGLRIGEVEVLRHLRERLETEHVRPFHRRLRHAFPQLSPPPPSPPAPPVRSLAFALDSYYPSVELCLGHYDPPCYRRGLAKMYYQPLFQIGPSWGRDVDLLLLVRTISEAAVSVARDGLLAGIPVGFYLDDDLLTLHEYGPPYDTLLRPGSPRHQSLLEQLARVDAVWATRPVIAESVRPHNPRILPHNGSVPAAWLPAGLRPRGVDGPVRVGYVGGGFRIAEFSRLWEALRRLAAEFGDRLIFEFWGVDVSALPPLASPVEQRPYVHSYQLFMRRLRESRFDVLLTPLNDYPRSQLAKTENKYYHTAVAGALGVFSDVPPYAPLPHGVTCLKTANDPDAWYAAVREAVTMPAERFDRMRRRMLEHVRLEYTEEVQIHLHEAAVRATEFHAATRDRRGEDGRPRVRHRSPGAAEIAKEYGVEVIAGPGEAALTVDGPAPCWVRKEVFDRGLRRILEGEEADLLVDRSGSAEMPAALWEALAGGTVVVSNSPGAREFLVDGVTAALFDEDSEEAVERARAARARLQRDGWRLARCEVHPQRAASELFALYNRALREPAVAAPIPEPPPPPSRRERLRDAAKKVGIYRPLSRLYWARRRKRVLVTYESYIASTYLYWDHAKPALEAATGRSWLLRPAAEVPLEDLYSFHAVIVA